MQPQTDAVLQFSGLSHGPQKGFNQVGVSKGGHDVFSSQALGKSSDTTSGQGVIHAFLAFVTPLNVLSSKDKDALKTLMTTSSSQPLIKNLDKLSGGPDGKRFMSTALAAVKGDSSNQVAAHSAHKLFSHWSLMSPAQKSLGIATLGLQAHKASEGGTLYDLKVLDGPKTKATVQDAFDLLKQGKNPYSLFQNWNQIADLHKVSHGETNIQSMADFAKSNNFSSDGPNDKAVQHAELGGIARKGGKPAPQYGVGAIAMPQNSQVPPGYQTAAKTKGTHLMVPQANASSSAGALQGSLVGTAGGEGGQSQDAVNTYKGWNKSDATATNKGAEGGSALLSGLGKLKDTNPHLHGAMVALLTRNSHQAVAGSNPQEYAASLAGIALARIVTGKKGADAETQGASLGKRFHSGSQGNFDNLQANLKKLYALKGVSSKADAYQLANQAYSEGRINETDLAAMHEVFNIVYDKNGLESAQRLMTGKERGLEIAKQKPEPIKNTMEEGQKERHQKMSKAEVSQKNAARYNPSNAPSETPAASAASVAPNTSPVPQSGTITPNDQAGAQDVQNGAV